MSEYLLTIYIPTYNRAELAARQVEFLCNECAPYMDKVQIVISNNCSTDDTEERLKKIIEGTKIEYYCNEKNIGIRANYYECKKYTRGEYLWTVSDDDVLKKGVVKKVVDLLEHNRDLNFVMLNYEIKHPEGVFVPWTGKYGFWENALPELYQGVNGYAIILSSAVIYKYKIFETTMEKLPLDDLASYGMHFFTGALAIKTGRSYISENIWVTANNTSSWYDIMITSFCGMMKSFTKLEDIGFSRDELRNLYKGYVNRAFFNALMSSEEKIAQDAVRSMIVRYPERFMRWFFDYHKHEYGVEIIADKIKRNKKPLYIYCAGACGKKAADELQRRGVKIAGFFDGNKDKWGKQIQVKSSRLQDVKDEISLFPCYNFAEFLKTDIQILIANENKKIVRIIKDNITQKGITAVYVYKG